MCESLPKPSVALSFWGSLGATPVEALSQTSQEADCQHLRALLFQTMPGSGISCCPRPERSRAPPAHPSRTRAERGREGSRKTTHFPSSYPLSAVFQEEPVLSLLLGFSWLPGSWNGCFCLSIFQYFPLWEFFGRKVLQSSLVCHQGNPTLGQWL